VTFKVGTFSVTRVEEMLTPGFLPEFLFPQFDRSILDEHAQLCAPRFWHAESGKVMSSMHSWLIRNGDHTILIDTGCGNGKTRALPIFQRFHQLDLPYLERLADAGVRPGDVTLVICTHLHIDHVGWDTTQKDGVWAPTFPNARYVFGRREFEHWRRPDGGLAGFPENGPVIEDSVMPVVDADLAEFVEDEARLLDGLEIEWAPGHTAGQFMVKLASGRDAAVFPGDCLHQPMQVYRPDWNSRFCEQAETARDTRRRVLDYCADRNALLMPAHFGAPHCGRVRRSGGSYAFAPTDDLLH
jgi:glyoxylase-like metal-dependent hydrolase (beta-lactamase superfamily II)